MALTTYTPGEVLTAASLNDNFTFAAANPVSKIAQVISVTKTDTFTLASTTYTDVTDLTVSITPSSATSKVLVFAVVNGAGSTGVSNGSFQIVRDATAISIATSAGSRVANTAQIGSGANFLLSGSGIFLDSPATTSATTYKIQVRANASSSVYINRAETDTNDANYARTVSSITVMEVLA